MRQTQSGYYSLVQFVPDRARSEAANVGVLLYCRGLSFLDVRLLGNTTRIRKRFGAQRVSSTSLHDALKALRNRIQYERQWIGSIDELKSLIGSLANEILITEPRPTAVEYPEQTLRSLFDDLVAPSEQRVSERSFPEVDQALGAPSLASRVRRNREVTVPVIERQLRAPYWFQNGHLNLVVPERFGPAATAKSAAMRLAVEGDLLNRHPLPSGQRACIIVVPILASSEWSTSSRPPILRLLDEYGVRTVPVPDLPDLVQEIWRTAHPIDD